MTREDDLYRVNPNGVEIRHGLDDYDDVTFLVSNCDSDETAIQRVRELLAILGGDTE